MHSFNNSEFKFRIKKKPYKIQNLFSFPRIAASGWWPIRTKVCYYHPEQQLPIIYECSRCKEFFCCTTVCYLHHTCSICNMRGCGCDAYRCGCQPLRDKQKKALQTKITYEINDPKIQRKDYSEYYKYCLKCVGDNLKTNRCYLCKKFCYYGYEKCMDCNKVFHM